MFSRQKVFRKKDTRSILWRGGCSKPVSWLSATAMTCNQPPSLPSVKCYCVHMWQQISCLRVSTDLRCLFAPPHPSTMTKRTKHFSCWHTTVAKGRDGHQLLNSSLQSCTEKRGVALISIIHHLSGAGGKIKVWWSFHPPACWILCCVVDCWSVTLYSILSQHYPHLVLVCHHRKTRNTLTIFYTSCLVDYNVY